MAEAQPKRLVFMGTPEFAATILNAILELPDYEVAAVYTQPDRPAGRGLLPTFPAVKNVALKRDLPVFQPASLRNDQAVGQLLAFMPDFLIVAAYGLILPQAALDVPKIAAINVHASLLPRYRGAAPVQRAIMENWQPDAITGVSIMKMSAGLDTGPVYATSRTSIGRQNAGDLQRSLAKLGGELLIRILPEIAEGTIQPLPQDDSKATYAQKLRKADGKIDWSRPALEVDALVRAVTPWPGAHTVMKFNGHGKPLATTVISGIPADNVAHDTQPGQIRRSARGLEVACADRWYHVERILPQGKKAVDSASLANGYCKVKNGHCGYAE